MDKNFIQLSAVSMNKKFLSIFAVGLVVYLLTATFSYAVFSFIQPGSSQPTSATKETTSPTPGKTKRDPNLPRTEECPLNGQMLTKDDRSAWEKRRPMGIMIENSKVARPQSGLSSADVIYEAVAEGGITRFLAVFYCQNAETVGPVRSARTYYLDWISEYANFPLYVHAGGANTPGPANALGQIQKYGWGYYNDLDQFSISFPTFWQDTDRLGKDTAIEHSLYTSTEKLWNYAAQKRKITNVNTDPDTNKETSWDVNFTPWSFKDDLAVAERPQNFSAEFNFSKTQASYLGDYSVKWQYDHDSNSFLRFNGGTEHKDMDTNQQILAKNVVILFTTMTVADDGYDEPGHGTHTLYGTIGSGKAKFLIDGAIIDGTWKKKDRTSRTVFTDDKGKPLAFNRGQIWVEVLPIGTQVATQ